MIVLYALLLLVQGTTSTDIVVTTANKLRIVSVTCNSVIVSTYTGCDDCKNAGMSKDENTIAAYQPSTQKIVLIAWPWTGATQTVATLTGSWAPSKMAWTYAEPTRFFFCDSQQHALYYVYTSNARIYWFAGSGTSGYQDGSSTVAMFNAPQAVATTSVSPLNFNQGARYNVYMADTGNKVIRKIDYTGSVTTVAGIAGVGGSVDGAYGTNTFDNPIDIDCSTTTTVIVLDNLKIRKLDIGTGVVSTLGSLPTGASGFSLNYVNDYLIYTNSNTNQLYHVKISIWKITVFAGNGVFSSSDGTAKAASFAAPTVISGGGFACESINYCVTGVSWYAAVTCQPCSTCGDGYYVSGACSKTQDTQCTMQTTTTVKPTTTTAIPVPTTSTTTTAVPTTSTTTTPVPTTSSGTILAASGTYAVVTDSFGGPLRLLSIGCPDVSVGSITCTGCTTAVISPDGNSIFAHQSALYIGGATSYLLKFTRPFTTAASPTVIASVTWDARISKLVISPDGSTLYFSDGYTHCIHKFTIATNTMVLVAGALGVTGYADGSGVNARFVLPMTLAVSPLASSFFILVVDVGNLVIRRIDSNNMVTTVAGTAGVIGSADGLPNTFRNLMDITIAPDATVAFIIDQNAIRKLNLNTMVVTTLVAAESLMFSLAAGITIVPDASYLIVSDRRRQQVVQVTLNPLRASVIAGSGEQVDVDGNYLTASFRNPMYLSVWGSGSQVCCLCPAGQSRFLFFLFA